jgi:hypothetical protein
MSLFTDEFVDFYFKKKGALYQWVFQYMPIGRGADTAAQVPPHLRKSIWVREQEVIKKERLLIADFWNGGLYSSGCIAVVRDDISISTGTATFIPASLFPTGKTTFIRSTRVTAL